jgi:hypothetical protein
MKRYFRPQLWLPAALVLALVGTSTASAQTAAGSREYKTTIAEALKEYNLGHWSEAEALFARAHELNPNARTLRGMGFTAFESRRYVLAVTQLKAALAETRNALTAAQRREAQLVVDRASAFIAHFQLLVTPENAELTINGAAVSRTESNELLLDPGDYEVVATAPGFKSGSARVTAEGGSPGRIVLELEPERPALPPPEVTAANVAPVKPSAEQATTRGEREAPRILMYTGFAVAGAGLLMGSITGIVTLGKAGTLKDACPGNTCPPAQRSKLDGANTLATVSNVSFGVAAAGAVAGVIGLWLHMQDSNHSEHARGPALEPGLALDRVVLTGHF